MISGSNFSDSSARSTTSSEDSDDEGSEGHVDASHEDIGGGKQNNG